jgi:hypothetical protein
MSKKTSMVVYEDWIVIATEMLSGEECKTFLQNLLSVYKGEEPVLNTPLLKSVWKLVGSEVESNKSKRDSKVERITNARKNNSKHQVTKDVVPSMEPSIVPNVEPNIESNVTPNMEPVGVNVNVNVNVNDNVNDNGNENGEMDEETMGEPSVDWFLNELENKGNISTLKSKYPKSSSLSEAIGMYFQ